MFLVWQGQIGQMISYVKGIHTQWLYRFLILQHSHNYPNSALCLLGFSLAIYCYWYSWFAFGFLFFGSLVILVWFGVALVSWFLSGYSGSLLIWYGSMCFHWLYSDTGTGGTVSLVILVLSWAWVLFWVFGEIILLGISLFWLLMLWVHVL